MSLLERHTLPIPLGHHVYILSGLDLSATSSPGDRAIVEWQTLLGDLDGPAVVIVAGDTFFAPGEQNSAFLSALWRQLPALHDAWERFLRVPSHRLILLPGDHDGALLRQPDVIETLGALGITVASDVILQVAHATGVRDIAVAAGSGAPRPRIADSRDQSDGDRLEDPQRVEEFVASRTLYRRLGPLMWFMVGLLGLGDLFNSGRRLLEHFTHHTYALHAPHGHSFWGNLILNFIILVVLEGLLISIAAFFVRWRMQRGSAEDNHFDVLTQTTVDGTDAVSYARRLVERGGDGAVVGGAPRSALAFLDKGFCASPGPSRKAVIEREGRYGLPRLFSAALRFSYVEIEAASTTQVRLVGGQQALTSPRLLERLVVGDVVHPGPEAATGLLGSWPDGSPFPVSPERIALNRQQSFHRRVASLFIFLDGLIDIITSTSKPLRSHLHLLATVTPLPIEQSAAVVTTIIGIALILLGRGVRRGQRRAWFIAVALVASSIVSHVARGGSVAGSIIAAVLLGYLLVQRRHFRAATDRTSWRWALPRIGAVAGVAVLASALAIEAAARHHHDVLPNFGVLLVACAERLIGQYAINLPDSVTDFTDPVLLTVGLSLLVSLGYVLTRPVVDRRLSYSPSSAERRVAERRARDIVRRHGRGTLDYFALRDDKQFFFHRDSLVAYAVYGGVALIAPDPIGPAAERLDVLTAFKFYADQRGWTLGVMAAGAEWLATYNAAGMHSLYLGDEAIVDCPHFSLEGGKMKGLRQAVTRLQRHGYSVEFLDPADVAPHDVRGVLDLISMLRRGDGERGFSMSLGRLFNPKDKGLLLTLVRDAAGTPVAACQFVPSPAIHGYSLDLMRRDPGDHPNGLIDFALCSTIAYLREQGAQGLSLNFAAFRSVLDGERGEGTFTRVERWTLRRLSGILPIESLWSFNAKYQPRWQPRHVVYPTLDTFVPVVAAIMRAEALSEIPFLGRFLANDPTQRPGTVVPETVLAAAERASAPDAQ